MLHYNIYYISLILDKFIYINLHKKMQKLAQNYIKLAKTYKYIGTLYYF